VSVRRVVTESAEYLIDDATATWKRADASGAGEDMHWARIEIGEPLIVLAPDEHGPLYIRAIPAGRVIAVEGA
jgi:phage baseplate assembly protein gpV